jgi:hypothetical protein
MGKQSENASPPLPAEDAAPQAKPEPTTEAERQAAEAAAKLKLWKVTSARPARIDSPNAAWSLVEGANHFEGELPESVALAYAKLKRDGVIKVSWLNGSGESQDWTPPELPVDDGIQR